ncbi:hypothetical protein WR25_10470 [Diploscapter pachys]|uniref:Uncharacterized protein n=1 Tax=Diploscapter pachys TaxID=2018661 RepID=A0A2A2JB47_9BILA|nr:hypothetical protein WR25_10470 [Diploscapter pachys]
MRVLFPVRKTIGGGSEQGLKDPSSGRENLKNMDVRGAKTSKSDGFWLLRRVSDAEPHRKHPCFACSEDGMDTSGSSFWGSSASSSSTSSSSYCSSSASDMMMRLDVRPSFTEFEKTL